MAPTVTGCGGEAAPLPSSRFFVFGEGNRRKLLYRGGRLTDIKTGEIVWQAAATREIIRAGKTAVDVISAGARTRLREDERGIWIDNDRIVSDGDIKRPKFDGPHAARLRALHHEVLVNVVDGVPLPNLFVYDKPWRRDAAMMAMCLEKTGNLGLITAWIRSLDSVFDRNAGVEEPDNIGQTLYLLALAGAHDHPLVARAVKETARFRRDDAIAGLTDGGVHAAYQTAWLKIGLQALRLPDAYRVPWRPDHYRSLAWWMSDGGLPYPLRFSAKNARDYPYLAWAEAHYWNSEPPVMPDADAFPQTWEANGAAADYRKMQPVDATWARARIAGPHGWHAAEAFLYLLQA
jgi:hypothetical protein